MSATSRVKSAAGAVASAAGSTTLVDGAVAGYGISAAIIIVFNTLLAWIKDSSPALNSFMASLSGHHWRTHGIVDVILFLVLGFFLTQRNIVISGYTLAGVLIAAILVGGGGLALWFVLI
jgi:hypothetical protein